MKIQGEPLVSILIPNKDHIDDLEKCLSSIYEKSTWKNYEILVVENNSEKPETFEYYKNLSWRYPKARVLTWKEGFNYAAINNFAAKDAKGSYLLFLNNDVEVITPGWIEEMLMICQQPDVAIVGAKLYYPDNLIQHAGVVLGNGGIAGTYHVPGIMRRQRIFRKSRKCSGNQCGNGGMHAYESRRF